MKTINIETAQHDVCKYLEQTALQEYEYIDYVQLKIHAAYHSTLENKSLTILSEAHISFDVEVRSHTDDKIKTCFHVQLANNKYVVTERSVHFCSR
jgi:ribosomal protein L21E